MAANKVTAVRVGTLAITSRCQGKTESRRAVALTAPFFFGDSGAEGRLNLVVIVALRISEASDKSMGSRRQQQMARRLSRASLMADAEPSLSQPDGVIGSSGAEQFVVEV